MDKIQFISETVLGWIKQDLTRMLTLRPLNAGMGNINFPLALCTLCYMDYLGSFLLGKDKNDYTKHISAYVSKCFINNSEYPVEIMGDIFRHGLAHDYFPRGAVSRNEYHPAVYKGKTYDVVLDAESLTKDFLSSLDVFAEELKDENFNSRMQEALDTIENKKKKYRNIIQSLPSEPSAYDEPKPSEGPPEAQTLITTTTPAMVSGASGLAGPLNITRDPTLK
jgi:hypothetical protein